MNKADAFAVNYKKSSKGLMQVHPCFSNVFFNFEGRVQIDNVTLPMEHFHFDKCKDIIGVKFKHLKVNKYLWDDEKKEYTVDNYLDIESNVFVNKSEK